MSCAEEKLSVSNNPQPDEHTHLLQQANVPNYASLDNLTQDEQEKLLVFLEEGRFENLDDFLNQVEAIEQLTPQDANNSCCHKLVELIKKHMVELEGIESAPIAFAVAVQAVISGVNAGRRHQGLPNKEILPVATGASFEILGASVVTIAAIIKYTTSKKTKGETFDLLFTAISGASAIGSAIPELLATLCEAAEEENYSFKDKCGDKEQVSAVELAACYLMLSSALSDSLPFMRKLHQIWSQPEYNWIAKSSLVLAIIGDFIAAAGSVALIHSKGEWDSQETANGLFMQAGGFITRSVGIFGFLAANRIQKGMSRIGSYFSNAKTYCSSCFSFWSAEEKSTPAHLDEVVFEQSQYAPEPCGSPQLIAVLTPKSDALAQLNLPNK